MGINYGSWILLFHTLVILLLHCSHGDQAKVLGERENKSLEIQHNNHHHNHMGHNIDPSSMVFFTLKDLKVGKTMQIYFPKRELSLSTLWPKEKAESLPFSSNKLSYLLKFFSFSQGSPQAIAMKNTLKECETKPIKGEVKFCATSLESMLEFTKNVFGSKYEIQSYATLHKTKSNVTFQNYTIVETPMEILAPKVVACHTLSYPYVVFYCHSQESENRVYRISLVGENGDKVEAMAVCHMDTSQWAHNHVSFQLLGVTPGSSSVCHFFPADNFVFIPKFKSKPSYT